MRWITIERRRWWGLYIECLGAFMVILDGTIVNVALVQIRADLSFSDESLIWVVDAFLIPHGGVLLLSGRLGDRYGRRLVFLIGIAVFTFASLVCGTAHSGGYLITGRALQGLGAGVVLSVALSLILAEFLDASERAKAVGIFSFACACGGSAGLLLGGMLVTSLGWRWIFLVNVPIGLLMCSVWWMVPPPGDRRIKHSPNFASALALTSALFLASYTAVQLPQAGASHNGMRIAVPAACALFTIFLILNSRAGEPLISPKLLCDRNLSVASLAGVLWTGAHSAWLYLCSLYMQRVLGYGPLEIGLAFLPVNVIHAGLSLGLAAVFVRRFGVRLAFLSGVLLCGVGLFSFSFAPVSATFLTDLLPGMLLIGLGAGIGYSALLLAAVQTMTDVDYGASSGILNSLIAMAAPLFVAALGGIAASRADGMILQGMPLRMALTGGYHLAFGIAGCSTSIAALLGGLLLMSRPQISVAKLSR